jgi:hypothetical protein
MKFFQTGWVKPLTEQGALRGVGAALCMLGSLLGAWPSQAQTPAQMPASKLFSYVGVDTQMAYTDGAYANVAQVIADLHYLGVCHVRDGISNGFNPFNSQWNGSGSLSVYQAMAASCVHFTFLFGSGGPMTPGVLQTKFAQMLAVETATPGAIEAFEILNEISNFNISWNGDSVTGCDQEYADAIAAQRYAYHMVKTTPAVARVPVIMSTGFSSYDTALGCVIGQAPNIALVKGLANFSSAHPYPYQGTAPGPYMMPGNAVPGQSVPAVYTEWGYSTNGGVNAGVNEDVQMRYGLDGFLDAASTGTKTFMYALLDAYAPGSPQGDQGWGLFDYTGAPKQLAIALHNLHQIIKDAGRESDYIIYPNFTLSGLPVGGSSLALGRHDGTAMEVLWAEPPLWDAASGTERAIVPQTVEIELGAVFQKVEVFDPTMGTSAVQSFSNVAEVSVTLGASPLVIKAR